MFHIKQKNPSTEYSHVHRIMRNNKLFLKQLSFRVVTQKQITDTVPKVTHKVMELRLQMPYFSILYHLNDKIL